MQINIYFTDGEVNVYKDVDDFSISGGLLKMHLMVHSTRGDDVVKKECNSVFFADKIAGYDIIRDIENE